MKKPYLYLHLEGSPEERGEIYGRSAKEAIERNLKFYSRMFKESAGVEWSRAKSVSEAFIPDIEAYSPDSLEEMKGVAKGSGFDFYDILTLNCRSEILFANPDGCSCVGIPAELGKDSHVYLAQTWDWLDPARENVCVLKITQPPLPTQLIVTEAGIIGGKGLNSAGIGVCLNATSIGKGGIGVPLHIMYREILNETIISNALDRVAKAKRAGSGTFTIGSSSDFIMSVEFTPDNFDVLMENGATIAHTNHYLSNIFKPLDTFKRDIPDTFVRLNKNFPIC